MASSKKRSSNPAKTVESGQLLAVLDGKEIRWKLAEAIARREAALKERDQAMAAREIAAKQLAQLQADGLGLQVDLLQYQRDHLEVRAPIAGTLISGNLERSRRRTVSTGQKLFDIAPIDRLEVEIAIPDSEVSQVAPGQEVSFRLESQAYFRHGGVLTQIYPISEVRDGRNASSLRSPRLITQAANSDQGCSEKPGSTPGTGYSAGRSSTSSGIGCASTFGNRWLTSHLTTPSAI